MAGRYNFTIEQNAVSRRTFQWRDTDQNPINLTGSTVTMVAHPYKHAPIVLTPYLTTTPLQGKIVMDVPAVVTNTFNFSSMSFELRASGIDERIIQGVISINRATP